MEPIVRAKNIDTYLEQNHVLDDVDLEVGACETVALLGGNGSGKTTLLRTILGLIPHQSGSIELFGTTLERFKDWRRIGYVPQASHSDVPNATVTEMVCLGLLHRRRPFVAQSKRDRQDVAQAIERVGLAGREKSPYGVLSGGQKKRAMLARALVSNADLLVLDEPLAALDTQAQTSLSELFTTLAADGHSILVVLHELGPMEQLIDRAVVLRTGKKIYDGPLKSEATALRERL